MTINNVILPYPDFIMGEVIDPEQFDLNNAYTVTKINEIVTLVNVITDSVVAGGSGADKISLSPIAGFASSKLQAFLQEIVDKLRSQVPNVSGASFVGSAPITGVVGTNIHAQLVSLKVMLDAIKLTADTNKATVTSLQTNHTALQTDVTRHKTSADHDSRYYTKAQLDGKVRGGDTVIRYDVFTITNGNNGDGTFSYEDSKGTYSGVVTPEGYQTFSLINGFYNMGENRIEAMVNDTLHRSVASGGLVEVNPTVVTLTEPEGMGAEITFKYFERVGLTGEHALSHADGGSDEIAGLLYVSSVAPQTVRAGKLWGKVF